MNIWKFGRSALVAGAMLLSTTAAFAATKLEPKTIGVIVMSLQSESLAEWATQVNAAAAKLGWKVVIKDGESNPAVVATRLPELLAQNVDAVITMAVDAPLMADGLPEAAKKGVPVIATSVGVNPAGAEQFSGVYAVDDLSLGQALAKYLIEKKPGSVAVGQTASVVYAAHQLVVGARDTLKDSPVKMAQVTDVDITNLVQSFSQTAIDLAQAHPDAKALISCCDFAPAMVLPALASINRTDMLVMTRLDNPSSLQAMKSGAPLVIATFRPYYNLAAIDVLAKHFATGAKIPAKLPELTGDIKVIDGATAPKDGRVYPFEVEMAKYADEWAKAYTH